jgi:hypothetical protein
MWWTAPTLRHRSAIGWLCRNGAGQQDGPDRLGGVGQGQALSVTNMLKQRRRPNAGLNRGIGLQSYVEDVEESRGDDGLMRTGWTGDRENPLLGHALSSAHC